MKRFILCYKNLGLTRAFISTNKSSSSANLTAAPLTNSFMTGKYLKFINCLMIFLSNILLKRCKPNMFKDFHKTLLTYHH